MEQPAAFLGLLATSLARCPLCCLSMMATARPLSMMATARPAAHNTNWKLLQESSQQSALHAGAGISALRRFTRTPCRYDFAIRSPLYAEPRPQVGTALLRPCRPICIIRARTLRRLGGKQCSPCPLHVFLCFSCTHSGLDPLHLLQYKSLSINAGIGFFKSGQRQKASQFRWSGLFSTL